jgi:predicted ATPase
VPAPAGTETAQRQRPGTAPPPAGGQLVGREGLIGQVTVVLQAVRRSQGGALVLRGPAGIGKSSLLAAAGSAGTDAGMRVLAAKGVRNESDLPFAGLHQLIRPLLGGLAQLPAEQAELLRSAFGDSRAGANRFGIALATLDLLAEAAARQPVLVLADDAQWLDDPTTDVLAFVGRRLAIEPIALLACVRDGTADPFADAELPVVRVGPLDDDAARACFSPTPPACRGHARTGSLGPRRVTRSR